jgi:hypothetical protein
MDNFEICPCCGSNACIKTPSQDNENTVQLCWTCGFTTNDLMVEGSEYVTENLGNTAQLIKDLSQIHDGLVWFPIVLNIPNSGMVFPEWNKRTRDWYWTVVKAIPIPEEDQSLYIDSNNQQEKPTHKMDTANMKYYNKNEFMDAAEEIGIFDAE